MAVPDGKKKFKDMFSRFERIPACDRRPDCYDSIVRAMHIESRGKNWH